MLHKRRIANLCKKTNRLSLPVAWTRTLSARSHPASSLSQLKQHSSKHRGSYFLFSKIWVPQRTSCHSSFQLSDLNLLSQEPTSHQDLSSATHTLQCQPNYTTCNFPKVHWLLPSCHCSHCHFACNSHHAQTVAILQSKCKACHTSPIFRGRKSSFIWIPTSLYLHPLRTLTNFCLHSRTHTHNINTHTYLYTLLDWENVTSDIRNIYIRYTYTNICICMCIHYFPFKDMRPWSQDCPSSLHLPQPLLKVCHTLQATVNTRITESRPKIKQTFYLTNLCNTDNSSNRMHLNGQQIKFL